MNAQDTAILESGQRVGLAATGYPKELAAFPLLKAANDDRAELVTARYLTAQFAGADGGQAKVVVRRVVAE